MRAELTTFDPAEHLKSDQAIADFMAGAFETNDPGFIAHARDVVARAKRRQAIDFARASVELEGLTLSPEVEAINRRYIDGELTGDEHVAAIRATARACAHDRRTVIHQGALYLDWRCQDCGATGRDTWD